MPRSYRTTLQGVLLVASLLASLVAVRWLMTGSLDRPMAPSALAPAPLGSERGAPLTALPPPGTRLSLGGRQPIVVDPASGTVARIPPDSGDQTVMFRQGSYTVLVADRRAWAAPAGRAGPRWPLGGAAIALPALADDRVWLVDARYGASGQLGYTLVEVGLADGRAHTRWTLPYQAVPVAVLPSGLLARDLEDDLEVVEPGSGRVWAILARTARFVDARGSRVAWLAGRDLHVHDLATGAETVVPPPPGSPDWYTQGAGPASSPDCCFGLGAFAPDGRTLAVYARLAGPGAPGLALVDLDRGRAALLRGSEGATPTGCRPCLAWASNGWLYFFGAGPATTSIGAWRPGEGSAGLLRLDIDEALDRVPSSVAAN
jgi:hypothetical protein